MAIELWRPTREVERLTDEMERLIEETFGPYEGRPWALIPRLRRRMFPVNLYQKNNDLIVEVSLPGIRPEDVDVRVSGRTLTIRAERKEAKEVKEENYYYREMATGQFSRQVTLPVDVQADKAEATYENGMLRLRLPLVPAAREAHITVKTARAK